MPQGKWAPKRRKGSYLQRPRNGRCCRSGPPRELIAESLYQIIGAGADAQWLSSKWPAVGRVVSRRYCRTPMPNRSPKSRRDRFDADPFRNARAVNSFTQPRVHHRGCYKGWRGNMLKPGGVPRSEAGHVEHLKGLIRHLRSTAVRLGKPIGKHLM